MRYFDRLHPASSFVYFVTMFLLAMITLNPVIVTICYLSAVTFFGVLIGWRKLIASLAYSIPLTLMLAVTNPLFVHRGETILFFLNDNPVTKEAIVYGVFAALMLMSVFYLARAYTEIMTADKFIYLFGRVVPKLSLVLSMILAFLPKMKRKYREISEAQRALGIYATESYTDKILSRFRVLSILLTNCLETSVDTADSMRARGYGLRGRTSYAIYRFTPSDALFLLFAVVTGGAALVLILLGKAEFYYYPAITAVDTSPAACALYALLTLLSGASVFMEIKENIVWRVLRSGI